MDDHYEDNIKLAKRSKLENDNNEAVHNTNSQSIASSSKTVENSKIPDDLPDLVAMDTTKDNIAKEKNSEFCEKSAENSDSYNNTIELNKSSTYNDILPNETESVVTNPENTEPIENENHVLTASSDGTEPGTSNQTRTTAKNTNNVSKKRNYRARRISSSSSSDVSAHSRFNCEDILNILPDSDDSCSNTESVTIVPASTDSNDTHSKTGSQLNLYVNNSDDKNSTFDPDITSKQEMLSKEKLDLKIGDQYEDNTKLAKRSKLENENSEIDHNTNSQNIASSSKTLENPQIPNDLPDLIPMHTTNDNAKKKDSENCEKPVENSDSCNNTIQLNTSSNKAESSVPNPENTEPIENENHVLTAGSDETEPGTSNQTRATTRNRSNANKKRNYRPRRISSSSPSTSSDESTHTEENPILDDSDDSSSSTVSSITTIPDSHSHTDSVLTLNLNDTDEEEVSSPEDSSYVQEILSKEKPKYKINLAYEIMNRENGLSGIGFGGRNKFKDYSILFQNRISSSRNIIEKLKLMHNLRKHRGCVNSLNFNNTGELLCTGSDDLKICVWNWSANKLLYSFQSGHHSNVFQTKFINNTSSNNGLNIVSSGRDGEIRHAIIPPSGSGSTKVNSKILFKHSGSVHKIALCPTNSYEILTAGEDGHIVRCDLREKPIERIVTVKVNKRKVPLYSIAHHPLDPEFCVSGRDQYVRVYDKRNHKNPIYKMSPEHLHDKKAFICHVTCAVYNQTGTEILASYSDEDIFLFNTKCYIPGHFRHRYMGRSNNKTIKGVNFFGPNSEYVISGSDCGNLFFWDKNTETIINWMRGDKSGIVNCLEPHPAFPILATSGLDYDAKIWAPLNAKYPPKMEGLDRCIHANLKHSTMNNDAETFDDRTFFFFVRQCMRNRRSTGNAADEHPSVPNIESSSDDNEVLDSDGSTGDHMGQLPCRTQ